MIRRPWLLVLAFGLGLFSLVPPSPLMGQQPIEVPFEITGRTMGPIAYRVVVAQHPDTVAPKQLQQSVVDALRRVNELMSTYIPESDVSRFNQSESTEFQPVASETASVVHRAIEISKLTDGAFDITVGPAVNLWNFGPDKTEFELPSNDQIEAVSALIGYQNLEVQLEPPAIRKTIPGLKIDLSAIAKGYAVDQVAAQLDDAGCAQFMVEVGGEVMTRGMRHDGGPWRIGVERPMAKGRQVDSIAVISDQAMATSGDYRNFIEHEGVRYSHTIDPKTSRPVRHGLASACVIADDCMTADALATSIMVLGAGPGKTLCDELGVQYLLVERDGDFGDTLNEVVSQAFPLKDKAEAATTNNQSIWPTFIGALVVFGVAVLAMAVGSIFANKPVRGSCGGLANMTSEDGDSTCGVCSQPATDCVEEAKSAS